VVYPVKSCSGVPVNEAVLTEAGLDLDRAWMVVDAQGEFVSQRELPRMALIRPQLKTYEIILRAPGMLALHLAIDAVEQPVRVRVWDDEVPAYDMGAVAAQWFSDFLGQPLRLVRFDPAHRRLSSLKWTGGIEAPNQFSDGFPVLVTSEASLDDLNGMSLKCGIVGLPNVGKSTLFNALTKAGIAAENYPFCTIEPNVGVVELPDPRLAAAGGHRQARAHVPAIVEFVDIAGLVAGASKGEGLGNQFLATSARPTPSSTWCAASRTTTSSTWPARSTRSPTSR
jgi:hypothetical protein